MRRLTVSFTDEQFAWVQEQADERDRAKKWVIQQAVDAARGDESTYGEMVPPGDTSTNQTAPGDTNTHQRLAEVEQRLADLEDVVASPRRSTGVDGPGTDAPHRRESNGPARAATDAGTIEFEASAETPQPSPEREGNTEGDISRSDTDHTQADSGGSVAALQELELPGSGDVLEARRATIGEMYSLLQERAGQIVKTGELKALVDPDDVGYASVESFWSNAVKGDSGKGRPNALTSLPGVRELGNGRYQYRPE